MIYLMLWILFPLKNSISMFHPRGMILRVECFIENTILSTLLSSSILEVFRRNVVYGAYFK